MPESIVTAVAPNVTGPEKPAEPTPVTVPEKFMKDGKPDYEALTKSYLELEKRQPAPKAAETPATPTQTTPSDPTKAPENPTPQPQNTATPPGFEKFEQEFTKNGKLSDESYAEIAKTNPAFTKEVVNDFISYRQGKASAYEKDVYDSVGGQEAFKQLSDWASKNLQPNEIEAINTALADTKNAATAKLALSGLKARFIDANGVEPANVVSGSPNAAGLTEFSSIDEAIKATHDPRYKTDENYRKSVDARMDISNTIFAGR